MKISELNDAVELFVEEYKENNTMGNYGETGYYPMNLFSLCASMHYFKENGIIKEKDKFIDLGSGFGNAVLSAAHHGLDSYGIEFQPALAKGSNALFANLKEKGIIKQNTICKVENGSYFPNHYIEFRNSPAEISIAKEYEKKIDSNMRDFEKKFAERVFKPVSSSVDIYEKLGVQLNEIDVFYCYCYEKNVPSVLEMFSLYSKKDSFMILNSAGNPEELKKELFEEFNLKEIKFEGEYEYEKVHSVPFSRIVKHD